MFPSSPLGLELSGAGGSRDLPLVFLFPFHSPASFLTSPEFPVFTAIWAAGSCLQAIWLNALEKKKKAWKAGVAANHSSAALHHTSSGFHLPDSPAKRIIML